MTLSRHASVLRTIAATLKDEMRDDRFAGILPSSVQEMVTLHLATRDSYRSEARRLVRLPALRRETELSARPMKNQFWLLAAAVHDLLQTAQLLEGLEHLQEFERRAKPGHAVLSLQAEIDEPSDAWWPFPWLPGDEQI